MSHVMGDMLIYHWYLFIWRHCHMWLTWLLVVSELTMMALCLVVWFALASKRLTWWRTLVTIACRHAHWWGFTWLHGRFQDYPPNGTRGNKKATQSLTWCWLLKAISTSTTTNRHWHVGLGNITMGKKNLCQKKKKKKKETIFIVTQQRQLLKQSLEANIFTNLQKS